MMGSAVNNTPGPDTGNKEENPERSLGEEIEDLEWTPDQEIHLLYSLHGLKPVGPHKHFRMILIQERLSNAMNKKIPTSVIWKKLNSWYDMEALDEAEAEVDASTAVEVDFELPLEDYGELMEAKLKGLSLEQKHNPENEPGENSEIDFQKDIKMESNNQDHNKVVSSDGESSKESDSSKGIKRPKNIVKEPARRGNKRTMTPIKDNIQKKDNSKEIGRKDVSKKEELKKGQVKEEDKKEAVKKAGADLKKEDKKEDGNKLNKKDSINKKTAEQTKREIEGKKIEQKKLVETPKNQQETPKQLRTDPSKRGELKSTRSETPKQKADLKKETNSHKKKEVDKKIERKSLEKTPDSVRGGKLRARKEIDSEKLETPTGTKRTKESISKATELETVELPTKKTKTLTVKGRPTRNLMEPQKPASSASSSQQKRRTRLQ